ncbi:hypothetical protein [Cecembia calidifontis]|uniref:hypothetical protein n=1 Tax=Cecembia calidifontis TaxID=1187080 RepID=UPI00102934A9|nr:hypothetical protein [Cecembia calidifontis]
MSELPLGLHRAYRLHIDLKNPAQIIIWLQKDAPMQPLEEMLYLSYMERRFHAKLRKERKRWVAVVIICALSSMAFSSQLSFRSITYHLVHPLEFFKMEQENPFYKILTIFKTGDVPDKLKKFKM